ncbi:MAG: hypothetical protein SFT93_01505 [Rickettsiaceae bacterium]|nr:hypothetical protein [Rickettsiaceae bacterium]
MSGIKSTPVTLQAKYGVNQARLDMTAAATKFATGRKYAKPSENVFANLEASSSESRLKYTDSAFSNLLRLESALVNRNGMLQTMKEGVQMLVNIALQAAGNLPETLRESSKSAFDQILKRVANIPETAEYAGIKLLNGTFGSASDLASGNPIYNARPVQTAALSTIVTTHTRRTGTLTFAANTQLNDTFTLGSGVDAIVFTFKTADIDETQNQILIGPTANDTALNTLKALNKSTHNTVKKFGYELTSSNVITLTQLTVSDETMTTADFQSSSTGVRLTHAFTAGPGFAGVSVNTEKYVGNSLLGQVGPIALVNVTTGVGTSATWQTYRDAVGFTSIPALGATNANDALAKFSFKIGTDDYYGYIQTQNAGAVSGIDNTMYCIKATDDTGGNITGKVFTMYMQANQVLNTAGINAFISGFNTDAPKLKFKQSNYMKIDTTGGEISVNNVSIGSVTGMTAVLTTDKFTKLKVTNVLCNTSGLTVTITDGDGTAKDYTVALPASNVFSRGTKYSLTHAASSDTLDITFASDVNASSDDNRKAISNYIRNALGSQESSTYIVGTDVSQTLSVSLRNMTWSVLTGGQSISVDSQSNANTATIILSDIVNVISSEIGDTSAIEVAVGSLKQQLIVSQQTLSASLQDLIGIDITEARTELDYAMQTFQGCIGAMLAEQRANAELSKLIN